MAVSQLARVVGEEASLEKLLERIASRSARVGVIGLGYVGLPLAVEFAQRFGVVGFDTDPRKIERLGRGESYIMDVEDERVGEIVKSGAFSGTTDFNRLVDCDAIIICVPTPLEKSKSPDLSYVEGVAHAVAKLLRPGQLVVLESTTYPGTTDELLLPLFQSGGLELDKDFLLAFSPERIDPGNKRFKLVEIPKVVGGCSNASTEAASLLYGSIMERVHPVSTSRAAEAAKLLENTFRLVNIGLANEMALLCHQLGMDANEVIEAAATKPFGFMPFYPGPGVGGHCIPLDPLYLSWKAKQQGFISHFIALADEVNSAMPAHIVALAASALNDRSKSMRGSRILLVGVAYKENINDTRQTPAIPILDRLRAQGANVAYHDPLVPFMEIDLKEWPEWRPRRVFKVVQRRRRTDNGMERRQDRREGEHRAVHVERRSPSSEVHTRRRHDGLRSVDLTDEEIARADCVIIVTAHSGVDYDRIAKIADVVIDTRNALDDEQRRTASGLVVRL
ncbi:MAG TPA: nucleotide sugar dehydrogenase [Candidatus Baltobacteraceae bacterium]|nr:nucleotide sugar dehydrogenase [Candidatus Baltobacteraceae bacterium]